MGSPTGGHAGWGLLGTKVVPPRIPRGYLRRRRLEKLLEAGVVGPLTLVSAGPGWGKTLAVASWIRQQDSAHHQPAHRHVGQEPGDPGLSPGEGLSPGVGTRAAWLTLDIDDNELRIFWTGVLTALRQVGAVPPDSELASLALAPGVTAKGLQRLRDGLAGLRPGTVLVLDDLHVVENPEVLESIAVLLRRELPLRLVLISRTDPVLPLHRLRVNGGLQEIRALDLAFDEDEATELLRLIGQHVDAEDVARLVERTEGWAAGLRLAGMFLSRDDSPGRADEFAGDDRAVAEYLLGEVFASHPDDMRTFLLRTSLTDRICGELADVLSDESTEVGGIPGAVGAAASRTAAADRGQGQRRLEALEQSNTFITSVGPHRQWYRYHPLLREALAHQLLVQDPELHRTLHRRAAVWLTGHGTPVAGLRHAAAARDWVLLGELFVTTAGPRILSAERRAINETLALIPESEMAGTPALQACAAAKLEYAGRLGDLAPVLGRARRMLARETHPSAAATAVIDLWGAAVGRATGDMQGVLSACSSTLQVLSTMDASFPAAEEYAAIAAINRGGALLWTGDLAGAHAELGPAITRCLLVDLDGPRLNGIGHLGLASVLLGRLAEADEPVGEARALAEARGWTSLTQSAIGDLARALILLIRGRPADAEPVLVQASAATVEFLVHVAIRIVHSLLNVSLDRPHAAARYARSAREMTANRAVPDFVTEWLALAEAEAALAAGDPKAALSALNQGGPAHRWWGMQFAVCAARGWLALSDLPRAEQALATTSAAAEDPANPVAAVEVWVVSAILADRLHDDARAVEAITRAVQIAAPEDIVRPFGIFDRVRVPRLLGRLSGLDATESAFVAQLGSANPVAPQPLEDPTPLVEPLTERELAVLQLLPSMQSNLEIAEEMFVSVNTVKVHLKTLYRKLDVPNRRSAVRRSRTLGLIP